MSNDGHKALLDIDQFIEPEKPKKPVEKRFNMDKALNNLAGAVCDPIIVWPNGWGTKDFIPEWLRSRITLDRLLELMLANKEGRDPIGTDSEALAYMMPLVMERPLGRDWSEIYIYLGTKVCESEPSKKTKFPDDIRIDKLLHKSQEEDLMRLKVWLYHAKENHRTEKIKGTEKEAKQKEAEVKAIENPRLF